MRHKSEHGINTRLFQSPVRHHPISHLHRTSSTVSTLFADSRDLISVTVILWTIYLKILLLDPAQPNSWMDPTHVHLSPTRCPGARY